MDELESIIRTLELERLRLPHDPEKRKAMSAVEESDRRLGHQRLKEATAEVFGRSKND